LEPLQSNLVVLSTTLTFSRIHLYAKSLAGHIWHDDDLYGLELVFIIIAVLLEVIFSCQRNTLFTLRGVCRSFGIIGHMHIRLLSFFHQGIQSHFMIFITGNSQPRISYLRYRRSAEYGIYRIRFLHTLLE
jgi:hypothetical protein